MPGDLAQEIDGPVLTDGVLNEYRYLDENNTIPLIVPVAQNETFIVALTFAEAPDPTQGPSVVIDEDGITPNANAIYASLGGGNFQWFSNSTLGVNGDWVIRAVVDCQAVSTEADVSRRDVGRSAAIHGRRAADLHDHGQQRRARRGVEHDGRRRIPGRLRQRHLDLRGERRRDLSGERHRHHRRQGELPAGGAVVYTVDGTVAAGTTGTLTNSATAVVGAPQTDPDTTNNSVSLDLEPVPVDDTIFADGFDD